MVLEKTEKISWADRVTNEAVLHRVKKDRKVLHTVKIRKANWIGHVLRGKCLLKHFRKDRSDGKTRKKT